jgi:hypothetical protein
MQQWRKDTTRFTESVPNVFPQYCEDALMQMVQQNTATEVYLIHAYLSAVIPKCCLFDYFITLFQLPKLFSVK